MTNYKKDLQAEQKAHAETKQELARVKEKLKGLSKGSAKEEPEVKIRYIRTPDLSQVSKEEIRRVLKDDNQTS